MTTNQSPIQEEEDGGGSAAVDADATSNSTMGIAKSNPLLFGGVAKRKPKKKMVDTFESYLIQESGDLRSAAEHWRKDAEIARRQGEPGRRHKSMAEYHRIMAQHSTATGDEVEATRHTAAAEQALKDAAKTQKNVNDAGVYSRSAMSNQMNQRPAGTNMRYELRSANKTTPARAPANGGKRFYYDVPFAKKDEAKKLGMSWDAEKKAWYSAWIEAEHNGPFKRKHV